ncbi:MAG: hypothetical protein LUQ13_03855 [Methanomicrobiales archaeon]|nr:hypothetical protein [Methanomicrobiales archaeon]
MVNEWRESWIRDLLFLLAKNIAKHDPSLSAREIDLAAWECAVRFLFLKACERWNQEPGGKIRDSVTGDGVHGALGILVEEAAQRYGDALMPWDMAHPERASVLPFIEDSVLCRVISGIPVPDGRTRWTDRVGACIEAALQREVVRDNRGVSYADRAEAVAIGGIRTTPAWLVKYCAGSLARELTDGIPEGADPVFRILDPSCGSGMYLRGVYRTFKTHFADPGRDRGQALCGIDRDPRAVDAARILFLLLMIEEGVADPSRFRLHDRILWGDPIIGHHLHNEEAHWLSGTGSWQHAMPVDWALHFPDAYTAGGFDGVIGSPPLRLPGVHRALAAHLQESYRAYPGGDLAGVYYAEKGLSLLREGGMLCMVLDRRWLRARSGKGLRRLLREERIREIVDFGALPVWGQVRIQVSVLQAAPAVPEGLFRACRVGAEESADPVRYLEGHCRLLDQRELDDGGWTLADRRVGRLIARVAARSTTLERYVMGKIHAGLPCTGSMGLVSVSTKDRIVLTDPFTAPLFRPVISRHTVAAFRVAPEVGPLIVVVRDMAELALFPGMTRILHEESRGTAPVLCARQEFEQPKLLITVDDSGIRAAMDRTGSYPDNGVVVIRGNNLYLLGILNSHLMQFVFSESVEKKALTALAKLPIYVTDPYDPVERGLHEDLVRCVRLLLARRKRSPDSGEKNGKIMEKEIDRIVYRLYGLSDDDIALVKEYTP